MSFVGSPLSRCFVPIACRRPAQLPARDMGLVCRGIIWFSIVFDDDAFDLCGVLFPVQMIRIQNPKQCVMLRPVSTTVILSKNSVLRTKIIEVSSEVLRG